MKFKLSIRYRRLSNEQLLDDIRRTAKKLRTSRLTNNRYRRYGRHCDATIFNRFGSWNNAVTAAGLEVSVNKKITAQMLHENIRRMWLSLGRQPTCMELKRPLSEFSYSTYRKHFGSWCKSLEAFEAYINSPKAKAAKVKQPILEPKPKPRRRVNRKMNYRLRYLVLRRDNHSCRSCGRSPANERGVKLHVDHIRPWSKGGETVLSNLQVLCEKCNLGKGSGV